jgi:hypothetical protein
LKYAFKASDYPLVLSIENHCSIEQQDKMADHLRTILKDFLYMDAVDVDAKTLPSPETLKRKILVKAKKLPPGKTEEDDLDDEEDEEDVDSASRKPPEVKEAEEANNGEKKKKQVGYGVNRRQLFNAHALTDSVLFSIGLVGLRER